MQREEMQKNLLQLAASSTSFTPLRLAISSAIFASFFSCFCAQAFCEGIPLKNSASEAVTGQVSKNAANFAAYINAGYDAVKAVYHNDWGCF